MTQVFLPCGEFTSPQSHPAWTELLFVDYDTMSPREKSSIDNGVEYGNLYVADYTVTASGLQVFRTDLGCSGEEHHVEIRVPKYVPKEEAIFWLADLVRNINDMGDF